MHNDFIQSLYTLLCNQSPYDFPENSKLGFPHGDTNRGQYSDISAHLAMLHFLALHSNSIVEIGVRNCYSTAAFLLAKKELWSIDLNSSLTIEILQKENLPNWHFVQGDSVQVFLDGLVPNSFDFLFIDGLHTYNQVKKELNTYHCSVNKFIVLHDTAAHSQGQYSRDVPGEEGIFKAVEEFLVEHPEWRPVYHVEFNHGLTVLERSIV